MMRDYVNLMKRSYRLVFIVLHAARLNIESLFMVALKHLVCANLPSAILKSNK